MVYWLELSQDLGKKNLAKRLFCPVGVKQSRAIL